MCGLGLPVPSASLEPSSPPRHNLVKSANTKIIQSQQHQQQPSALHGEPKPSFGCGGVQEGEMAREGSPQLHAQLPVTILGLWPGCPGDHEPNPSKPQFTQHQPIPEHTDDRLVWNTPRAGTAHRRLDRTRAGLLQVAAPCSSDTSTVTQMSTARDGMSHRKGHAPSEE